MSPIFLITIILFSCGQVSGVWFTLQGRNLPTGNNNFCQINEKDSNKCRTTSVTGQNPAWSMKDGSSCYIPDNQVIKVELRHDKSGGTDTHIGWAYVHPKNLGPSGTSITEEFWNGNEWVGTLKITTA